MKKTIYMLPALALLMLASCSGDDAITKDDTAQLNETPENAIGFDAYMQRSTTRAGYKGSLDNGTLPTPGFGVFGYYANGDLYSENAMPDFMYNQHITYSGGWTYSPIKYWPNEFGSSAISSGVDRVTFFAYAPYVPVDPTTGLLTGSYDGEENTGITSLTRNGKTGDPYVRYVGIFDPANCVDLCYGVAKEKFNASVGTGDGTNNIEAGKPYINVAKPPVGSKINFLFKHALAKLTMQVDADINVADHSESDADLNNFTRVWIRSITFDGVAPRGYLNLNSGQWYEVIDNNKISRASVTVYDGQRDGSEAVAADSYESPLGLNPALVQSGEYTATLADGTTFPYTSLVSIPASGVTKAYQKLFDPTTVSGGEIYVIPANEQLKITIVYDVETADATLPTYLSDGKTKGSTVENKITKYISIGGSPLILESNKQYNINLHLGLNSVDFIASVSDWDTPAITPDEPWLPQNTMTVANGATTTITVPASTTNYTFKVTGLTKDKTFTTTNTVGSGTLSPTAGTVPAGGEVVVNITSIDANGTTNTVPNTFTLTCDGKTTTVTIAQAPQSLGLSFTSLTSSTSLELGITTTTPANIADATSVSVINTTQGNAEMFESKAGNVVTLKSTPTLATGDVLKITVTSGEVTETIYHTVESTEIATTP